jgi:hypothetical protein
MYPDGVKWERIFSDMWEGSTQKHKDQPMQNVFTTDTEHNDPTRNNSTMESDYLRDNIFNRKAFIVTLIDDFAMILTFGLAFPPLGLVICCNILLNTWLRQIKFIEFFQMTQPKKIIDRDISIESTSSTLSKISVKVIIHELHEQSSDLTLLLWPVLPIISLLSAAYLSFFLFDMLGDQVGGPNAIWIWLITVLIPILVWTVQHLSNTMYRLFKRNVAESQQIQMATIRVVHDDGANLQSEDKYDEISTQHDTTADVISPLASPAHII